MQKENTQQRKGNAEMNILEALASKRHFKRHKWPGAWIDPDEANKIRYSVEDILANDWVLAKCEHKPLIPMRNVSDWTKALAKCRSCGTSLEASIQFSEWKEVDPPHKNLDNVELKFPERPA